MAGRALWATALAAVLLAGCSGGGPPATQGPADAAQPTFADVAFSLDVGLDPAETCAAVVCDAGNDRTSAPRLLLAANETPVHLRVTLEAGGGLPDGETAVLEVDCDPIAGECPVMEARGGLPLTIDQDLAAPAGAILRFHAYVEGRVTPAGPFTATDAVLNGEVRVLRSPAAPPTMVRVREAIDVQGTTAPCVFFAEPGCAYPNGSDFSVGPFTAVAGVNLTVTWDAVAPAMERLVLKVDCEPADAERIDCERHEEATAVTGTSPLTLSLPDLDWPPGSTVHFWVMGEQLSEADPYGSSYPLRQAYSIAGEVVHLEDADATNQG